MLAVFASNSRRELLRCSSKRKAEAVILPEEVIGLHFCINALKNFWVSGRILCFIFHFESCLSGFIKNTSPDTLNASKLQGSQILTTKLRIFVMQEEFVNEIFNRLYESLPKRQRGYIQEHLPGGGANGFAWADSLTTQLIHSGHLSVLFMGTLANNPTDGETSIDIIIRIISDLLIALFTNPYKNVVLFRR